MTSKRTLTYRTTDGRRLRLKYHAVTSGSLEYVYADVSELREGQTRPLPLGFYGLTNSIRTGMMRVDRRQPCCPSLMGGGLNSDNVIERAMFAAWERAHTLGLLGETTR